MHISLLTVGTYLGSIVDGLRQFGFDRHRGQIVGPQHPEPIVVGYVLYVDQFVVGVDVAVATSNWAVQKLALAAELKTKLTVNPLQIDKADVYKRQRYTILLLIFSFLCTLILFVNY